MPDAIITLTTDFGEESPYVAAMKGVILGINPQARIVDLSHQIPPQDVLHAAFFLAEAVPFFPPDVIHIVVVDPGVGTERHLLYVEVGSHRLLGPDNGIWTLLAGEGVVRRVIQLTERRYWRPTVSATFHGRDVLAPVAAHLSLGLQPELLGSPAAQWVSLNPPAPVRESNHVTGQVVFVDRFGNLISNIPASALPPGGPLQVTVAETAVGRWVRAYGEAQPGELIALVSSSNLVEIAMVQGNAARHLGVGRGAPIRVVLA